MGKNQIWLAVVVFALISGFFIVRGFSESPEKVACTLEAKICIDGAYVGRSGPNCEFALCPWEMNWATSTDPKTGFSFSYPPILPTKYIFATDWPPKLQVLDEPFSCTEAGTESDRAGKTEERTIEGRTYCVTTVADGAAGSVYRQFAYALPRDGGIAIFTFSLRFSQCGNYDTTEKADCETEREIFSIDGMMDRIARSLEK